MLTSPTAFSKYLRLLSVTGALLNSNSHLSKTARYCMSWTFKVAFTQLKL